MRLTIAIPTFNCAKFLGITLDSVFNATKKLNSFEIIVVDDDSKLDDPERVVNEFSDVVKFYRQEKNVGVANNFNTCLDIATGDYVHILHGDDYINPDFYDLMFEMIEGNPDLGLYFSLTQVVSELGQPLWRSASVKELTKPSKDISKLVYSNHILTPSVIINRKLISNSIKFNPELSYCTDWAFWVSVIYKYGGVQLPKVLANYRELTHGDSKLALKTGRNYTDLIKTKNIFKNIYSSFSEKKFDRRIIKEVFDAKAGYNINARKIFKDLNFSLSFENIFFTVYLFIVSKIRYW